MANSTINQGLPFNLDDLVNLRAIEGNRVEFKATWDENIKPAVVRTICAFANDLLNLNGGYIIVGIEEHQGKPLLPPRGLENLDLDLVQKNIYEACYRIQPVFNLFCSPLGIRTNPSW